MKLLKFIFLFIVVMNSACHSLRQPSTVSAERPNIIFIMTDDHSRKAVSAYDGKLLQTPNLDRIAEEGIKFNNAFVTNSLCGPARAVALTGKHSHINGFRANFDSFDGSQPTIPKYLQAAGYYTAIVGKWHLVSKPTGFHHFDILIDQGEYYNPRFYKGRDTIVETGYATNLITDKAIKVLEEQKGKKPVFLMVHQKAPHRNWMPDTTHLRHGEKFYELPESFYDDYATRSAASTMQDMRIENMFLGYDLKLYLRDKSEETGTGGEKSGQSYNWWMSDNKRLNRFQKAIWDKYYQPITQAYYNNKPFGDELLKWKYNRYMNDYLKCIQSVDDNVGRLLQYLKDNDLEKNTLVIYTSDQGFFLGEHGWYDKRFMYEPSLAIPLLMKWPSKIKAGSESNALVQNLDFAPTMLMAAGVNVPADMQGIALEPIFKNAAIENLRESIYYHFYEDKGSHSVQRHIGLRNNRYKLIYFYDLNNWELFDLQQDPGELKNIYRQDPVLANQLKAELKKLMKQYKDEVKISE